MGVPVCLALVVSLGACDPGPVEGTTATPPGEDATEDIERVAGEVLLGNEVVCEDPAAREQRPLNVADLGEDWAAQEKQDQPQHKLAASGLSIHDFDGDGLFDVYLPQRGPDQLWLRGAGGTLDEVSATHLPTGSTEGDSVAAIGADYDDDGDIDVFLAAMDGASVLLQNDGTGVFSDVSEEAGLSMGEADATGAGWGDLDGDGDLDLALSLSVGCDDDDTAGGGNVASALLLQDGGVFTDSTLERIVDPIERQLTRVVPLFDAEGDGDLDMYFIGDFQATSTCLEANALRVQDGGVFEPAQTFSGIEIQMAGMGVAIGELNQDGLPDVVLSDLGRLTYFESIDVLQWADAFKLRFGDLGDPGRTNSWGLELQDFDNDGDDDLYVGFGPVPILPTGDEAPDTELEQPPPERDALYLRDGEEMFADVASEWGIDREGSTRGVLAVDWNQDGWLDMARRSLGGEAEIFEAACGAGHWLRIRLEQPPPNRQAIGARIEVIWEERTWTEWTFAGGQSLYASRDPEVHVGLGEAEVVDLRITWPNGTVTEVSDVATNRLVQIRRLE